MSKVTPIFLIAFLLSSCSTQPPKEQEIKTKVYEYYIQEEAATAGNNYNVQEVTILSVNKNAANKTVFDVTAVAKGTFSNLSIAKPIQNQPFLDTLKMAMEWNGIKWITVPR